MFAKLRLNNIDFLKNIFTSQIEKSSVETPPGPLTRKQKKLLFCYYLTDILLCNYICRMFFFSLGVFPASPLRLKKREGGGRKSGQRSPEVKSHRGLFLMWCIYDTKGVDPEVNERRVVAALCFDVRGGGST